MDSAGGTRVTQTRRGAPLISTPFVSSRNRTTATDNGVKTQPSPKEHHSLTVEVLVPVCIPEEEVHRVGVRFVELLPQLIR